MRAVYERGFPESAEFYRQRVADGIAQVLLTNDVLHYEYDPELWDRYVTHSRKPAAAASAIQHLGWIVSQKASS